MISHQAPYVLVLGRFRLERASFGGADHTNQFRHDADRMRAGEVVDGSVQGLAARSDEGAARQDRRTTALQTTAAVVRRSGLEGTLRYRVEV